MTKKLFKVMVSVHKEAELVILAEDEKAARTEARHFDLDDWDEEVSVGWTTPITTKADLPHHFVDANCTSPDNEPDERIDDYLVSETEKHNQEFLAKNGDLFKERP